MTVRAPSFDVRAAELEEEYAALPTVRKGFTPRGGPGSAEVKPHTVDGVRKGLIQLAHHPAGERRLITYRFVSPASFRILVLTPSPEVLGRWNRRPVKVRGKLIGGIPKLPGYEGDDRKWFDALGTWEALKEDVAAPTLTMLQWRNRVGPTVFGSMAEPVVRDAFLLAHRAQKPSGWSKLPHVAGPDVAWQEVAEYLYELAGERSTDRR